MSGLQPFDFFVLITLGFMAFWGGCRGMFSQIMSIAAIVVAWLAASRFYTLVTPMVPLAEPWKDTVAMILLFFALLMILRLVSKMFGGVFVKKTVLKEFDRQLGALFGLLKGGIICLLVTFFAVLGNAQTQKLVINSPSGRFMVRVISTLQKYVPENANHAKILAALEKFSKAADDEGLSTQPLAAERPQDGSSDPNGQASESVKDKILDWFHSAEKPSGTGSENRNSTKNTGSNGSNGSNGSDLSSASTDAIGELIDEFESFFTHGDNSITVTDSSITYTNGGSTISVSGNPTRSASSAETVSSGSILDRPTFSPYSTAPPF